MSEKMKHFFPQATLRSVDREAKTARFIINTLAVDSYREIVMPEGMDAARYLSNPVLIAGHNWYSLDAIMGKAIEIKADGKGIEVEFLFAADANPAASTAFELVSGRFLNATSIGFLPIAWVNSVDELPEDQRTRVMEQLQRQGMTSESVSRIYTKWELLEVSLVIIPANPEALGKAARGECGAVAELVAKMFQPEVKAEVKSEILSPSVGEIIRCIERGFQKIIGGK